MATPLKLPEPKPELLRDVLQYRDWLEKAEAKLSEDLIGRMGLKKGDVIENIDSGLRYVIAEAWAGYSSIAGMYCSLYGNRLYKEGCRAGKTASSQTHLSYLSRYIKIEEPAS